MSTILVGVAIPFIGTVLGSFLVFFLKDSISEKLEKILLGFAAGVMIAASIWSLIVPAINMSESLGKLACVPAAVGFLLGIFFLLMLDTFIPHLHVNSDEPEGVKSKLKRGNKL